MEKPSIRLAFLKNHFIKSRIKWVFALLSGVLSFSLGFVALAGWFLKIPAITSFGSNYIPMAPDTALLFTLFGLILFLYTLLPYNYLVLRSGKIFAIISLIVSISLFYLSYTGNHPKIEHLGLSFAGEFSDAPVGHMSPLTALCFGLSALFLLVFLSQSSKRSKRVTLFAFLLACVTMSVSFSLMIAYLFGSPVMYGGRFIPPALPTSLAFLILTFGFVVISGCLFKTIEKGDVKSGRLPIIYAPVFILLATGVVTAGYLYYKNYERQFRTDVERSTVCCCRS